MQLFQNLKYFWPPSISHKEYSSWTNLLVVFFNVCGKASDIQNWLLVSYYYYSTNLYPFYHNHKVEVENLKRLSQNKKKRKDKLLDSQKRSSDKSKMNLMTMYKCQGVSIICLLSPCHLTSNSFLFPFLYFQGSICLSVL